MLDFFHLLAVQYDFVPVFLLYILTPLQNNRPTSGRKLRTIGVIVSPEQHNTKQRITARS